jgi:hypothetical protein
LAIAVLVYSESQFRLINDSIYEEVETRNEMMKNSPSNNYLPIDGIKLYVVNVRNRQMTNELKVEPWEKPLMTAQLINAVGGQPLLACMHKVLHEIYDLVSTTVSGIPMKEESQGQSVVYDVELIHSRSAYSMLSSFGLLSKKSKLVQPSKHGTYSTVKLNWCTPSPKYKSDNFPLLQNSFPATPAVVNSRPSVCLTTFVLSGKTVMLEVDRQIAPQVEPNLLEMKLISHYLCKNDVTGELMIQSVAIGNRATLSGALKGNDAAETVNKGVNFKSFSSFMKGLTVVPVANINAAKKSYAKNLELARHLAVYIPVSLKESFIYNIPERFEPLLSLIGKPEISAEDYDKCMKTVYSLIAARNGPDPLTHKTLDCSLLTKGHSK